MLREHGVQDVGADGVAVAGQGRPELGQRARHVASAGALPLGPHQAQGAGTGDGGLLGHGSLLQVGRAGHAVRRSRSRRARV